MIGWLSGHILDKQQPGKLVLDVQGVGYEVETSLNTYFQLDAPNTKVALHIHTVVREDALLLYGFLDTQERALFRALIKVNGVGPKLALAILSSITPAEFMQSIAQENALLLTKIPGVGKKTADRLLVEMRGSMNKFDNTVLKQPINLQSQEAISALEALGYKYQEASKVVTKIDNGSKSCEQLIRESLQIL